MKKKLLAILLAVCMVLSMAPAALAASVESCTGDCDHEAAIGSTHYDTLAEAMAAAENGSTVKLLDDLAIDTQTYTIVDGVSITLDMNEKKLTVTDSKTSGSYELFYIYGGLTVTGNGAIELTSTTDRGWDAMSAIFHNRGGVLTIEDGTFKNLGGTDMAWVVDNSGNWYGDATTNIEGGTLISTYTAIRNRMEQNEHGASGTAILNVSGGTISGTTSAIWAQAASVSTTAPATGEINISGGEIGLINTARSAGAECMTTISGGTVSSFKGEIGELAVTGGKITGEVTILTAADEETSYVVSGNGQYTSLKNAIANNSDITLQSNVTLTESIKISGAVTIDLNGYTIAGTDNSTGSFGLIEIQPGAELTINDSSADGSGKITLTATIDRDWNAFSSVISNQRGKLTVNGGTIQHLGGTDMAYGIDNLTNGKDTYAETVINGGTVKSTYRAIRQFLNGVEAQNILTVNGGTIEGTNKSIWMQDPSTNANSGTLTVDGGATLKGDVYLYVTPGSTEWPVTVSIASAALYGQSTVSYANVPAGYEVKTAGGYWGVDKVDESDPSVAAVKGVYFTALQEAISAAQSGDTVTLLADVELTETLTIPKGKSVTLDLNGKTISYSSDTAGEDMITNKGNLTITDNSDDQNGIITYCNTDTTASNVTVSTISCEPGSTLEVKSGTVKNDSANNALRGIYAYARGLAEHDILNLFEKLHSDQNIELDKLIQLEVSFLPYFRFNSIPKGIIRHLHNNPIEYVDLITFNYKPDPGSDFTVKEHSDDQGRLAYEIVELFKVVPGCGENPISEREFREWTAVAQEYADSIGYNGSFAYCFGRVLSYAPIGDDGIFPHEVVRDYFEHTHSEKLINGFISGKQSQRGVHTVTGGMEEKEISIKYREDASKLHISYPHTAAILEKLAECYWQESLYEQKRELLDFRG